MRLVTRHDGRPIVGTDALKLSNLANMVTGFVCRDSSFVALVKSVMNFNAALRKKIGLFSRYPDDGYCRGHDFVHFPKHQRPLDILALYPGAKASISTPQYF